MSTSIRYRGCDLENVYLTNGYRFLSTGSGKDCLHIDDIPGLHRAIALSIVDNPMGLDARTFKFLRKEQDLSQRKLAEILGVEEQTVSNWERNKTPIPKYADLLLRTLTKERCGDGPAVMDVIEQMDKLDREHHYTDTLIKMTKEEEWRMTQQQQPAEAVLCWFSPKGY